MSVIVRDLQQQKIILMCKGADSIIKARLRLQDNPDNNQFMETTQRYVDEYAKDGLRTLLLAKKEISQDEYSRLEQELRAAQSEVVDRDTKVEKVQSEIEDKMLLVGSTAIEDKLQEDVKETIESFKETGIKVWVLTGDKVETAINIGFSCGLLNNDMMQHVINTDVPEVVRALMDETLKYKQTLNRSENNKKEALVIAGEALTLVQKDE